MIGEIESLIRAAGFCSRPGDLASVYLTEAESAAIYAAKGYLTMGEVFLVCDAGMILMSLLLCLSAMLETC